MRTNSNSAPRWREPPRYLGPTATRPVGSVGGPSKGFFSGAGCFFFRKKRTFMAYYGFGRGGCWKTVETAGWQRSLHNIKVQKKVKKTIVGYRSHPGKRQSDLLQLPESFGISYSTPRPPDIHCCRAGFGDFMNPQCIMGDSPFTIGNYFKKPLCKLAWLQVGSPSELFKPFQTPPSQTSHRPTNSNHWIPSCRCTARTSWGCRWCPASWTGPPQCPRSTDWRPRQQSGSSWASLRASFFLNVHLHHRHQQVEQEVWGCFDGFGAPRQG